MKTLNKYILGLCAVAMFSMTSCYDLDQLPNDQVNVDFTNTTQAEQVLVGVYNTLNIDWIYGGRYGWDNCSDIAWCSNGWWASYDHYDIAHGNVNVWSKRVQSTWKATYTVIQRANRFIANTQASGGDASARGKEMVGEAKFIRALMYFDMLQLWGGVPLYNEENVFEESTLPRSTEGEVRAQIISDLEYAAANCADNAPGTKVGQVSKGAAYALLGKVYLQNKQYNEAISAFQNVISKGYALEADYRNIFRPAGVGLVPDGADNGKEEVFVIEHSKDMANRFGFNTQHLSTRSARGGGINVSRPMPTWVYSFKAKDGKSFDEKAKEILGDEAYALFRSDNLNDRVKFWGSVAIGYREGDENREDGQTYDKDGKVIDKFEIGRVVATDGSFNGYTPYRDKIRELWAAMDPRLGYQVILPYEFYDGYGTTNWDEYLKDNTVETKLGTVSVESIVWGYVNKDGAAVTNTHGNTNLHLLVQEYGQTSYVWRKFVEEGDWNGTNPDRNQNPVNWPVIRYADVLLMMAEAQIGAGNAGQAAQYINQVRARVGMPAISNPTMEDIMAERSYEFAMEGHRFWDLRRWGNYVSKTNGLIEADVFGVARGANPRSIAQSNGGYWPIHTDELGANPNLVQTPGW
jgi:hypothetical protein